MEQRRRLLVCALVVLTVSTSAAQAAAEQEWHLIAPSGQCSAQGSPDEREHMLKSFGLTVKGQDIHPNGSVILTWIVDDRERAALFYPTREGCERAVENAIAAARALHSE